MPLNLRDLSMNLFLGLPDPDSSVSEPSDLNPSPQIEHTNISYASTSRSPSPRRRYRPHPSVSEPLDLDPGLSSSQIEHSRSYVYGPHCPPSPRRRSWFHSNVSEPLDMDPSPQIDHPKSYAFPSRSPSPYRRSRLHSSVSEPLDLDPSLSSPQIEHPNLYDYLSHPPSPRRRSRLHPSVSEPSDLDPSLPSPLRKSWLHLSPLSSLSIFARLTLPKWLTSSIPSLYGTAGREVDLDNVGTASKEPSKNPFLLSRSDCKRVEVSPDNHLPDLTSIIFKKLSHPTAHGSSGDVWRCEVYPDPVSDPREVAVKIIRIDIAGDDSIDIITKFTQIVLCDYHARKELVHENLLPLLGISYDFGPLPAMVYPWMDNGSLTTYLEGHFTELTLEVQLRILQEVAAALEYLHSKGLVHGGLTANNVLMDSTGTAHVADHGILAMCSELSDVSYIRSNVRWAASELFDVPENEECLTPMPASDIHAFGCIILQVMTGQLPYADIENDHEVPVMILKGNKPARRPQSPHIEDSLWIFIEKCWSDPEHRPTAAGVSSYLQPGRWASYSRDPVRLVVA
ncbi:kinase-like domain-containing protein [Suillus lakei]|nr:kinase-like domain-containing protein [Suillus lakei]